MLKLEKDNKSLEKKLKALQHSLESKNSDFFDEKTQKEKTLADRNKSLQYQPRRDRKSASVSVIKDREDEKCINLSRKDSFMTNVSRRYQEDSDEEEDEESQSEELSTSIQLQKSFTYSEKGKFQSRNQLSNLNKLGSLTAFHKSQTLQEKHQNSLSPANLRSRNPKTDQKR